MKLNFTIAVIICFLYKAAFSQESLRGKVVNNENEPIPGVSVLVKGTRTGTTTSAEGTFSLNVSGTATLVVSGVGYIKQEVPIAGKHFLEIHLESDDMSLEEVVINGAYGSSDKKSFTGSATVVSSDKLLATQPTNLTQALQGASPGVQVLNTDGSPGSNGSITVRGISSVGAGTDPLYILDGMPYNGDLSSINPSDIESLTVLKDAAATTLYGSRAANGVIVITTKKGTAGTPIINAKSNFGFSDIAVPYPDKLNPQQVFELAWEALKNGQTDRGVSDAEAAQYATDNVVLQYFQNADRNVFNTPTPIGLDGKLKPDAQQLFYGDWLNELFSPRLRQEHNVDFSGAAGQDNRTQYFISGSYLNDKGYFRVQGFERFSGRANINSQVKKWLNVGSNVSYSHSFRQNPAVEARFTRVMPTVYPVYEWDYDNNTYVRDPYGNLMPDYGNNTRTEWRGWNPGFTGDYKNEYDWNFSGAQRDNLSTRNFTEITFIPGLKLKTGLSTDYQLDYNHSYQSATLTNSAGYGGWASRTANRRFTYTLNNLLTYDYRVGSHHFNVLAGQEIYKAKWNYVSISREGFPLGGLYEMNAAAGPRGGGSSEDNYRLLSYLSRIEYDYNSKYYFSASYRADGSSRFSPENRWGNFWSIGGAWILSAEDFLKNTSWIDNLKARASHGTVGNDQVQDVVGYYAYQGLYAAGYNDYNDPGAILSRLPTPDLVWESNEQTDVGVDFDLFGRLHGSIDWFNRKSKNLIFARPLSPSVGLSSIFENVGDIKNTGIEVELGADIFRGHAFSWNIDVNASRYKNEITRLPQNEIIDGRFKMVEGKSRYEYFGPVWAGVNPENGNNTWWLYTDNGPVQTEDYTLVNNNEQKRFLGSSIPDLFGAVTNNFAYKGVEFSFMLYYSIGGKMYDGDYAEGVRWRRGFNMSTDILDRWTPENTDTDIPRLSEYTQNNITVYSSQYLFDNSFLRLRNISLGYVLPNQLTERIGINRLKVFAQGTNLLTWGNAAKRGTDPETRLNGVVANGPDGTGNGTIRKSWSFGLQASF